MPDPIEELEAGVGCEKLGAMDEALRHFAAAAAASLDPVVRSEAFRRASFVRCTRCEWDAALSDAREAASIARAAHRPDSEAEALNAEAAVYQSRGEFERARTILEHSLTIASADRIRGIVLQNLGAVAAQSGDLAGAESRFLESFRSMQRAGYRWGEVFALNNYGAIALDRGDAELADRILRDAVAGAREVGDLDLLGIATLNLAEAQVGLLDYAKAEDLASTAMGYFTTANNGKRRVECLTLMGRLAEARGNRATALSCYERGLSLALELEAHADVAKLQKALQPLQEGLRARPLTPDSVSVIAKQPGTENP